MKYVSLLLLALVLSFTSSNDKGRKVIQALGSEKVAELSKNNPDQLRILARRVVKGFQIKNDIPSNTKGFTTMNEVIYQPYGMDPQTISAEDMATRIHEANFNVLCYKWEFYKDRTNRIILGNTGKAILLYSDNHLANQ